MEDILKQAYKDYLKLVETVKDFSGTLEQLCEQLKGFNFNDLEEKFDCDFGVLVATVYAVENEFFVERYIDIWDDANESILKQGIDYVDLKELVGE